MKRALVVAGAALLVLTCSALPRDPIVDGWPIGAPAACLPEDRCVELLEEAARGEEVSPTLLMAS